MLDTVLPHLSGGHLAFTVSPVRLRLASVAVGVALVGACFGGDAREAAMNGPVLTLVDSFVVREDPAQYLARPSFVAGDHRGGYYVTDAFHENVLHIGKDGTILGAFGGPGEGPGELRGAGLPFLRDDTTLAIVDNLRGRLQFLHTADGRYLGERSVPGIVRSAGRGSQRIWLGALDMAEGTGVVLWRLDVDSMTPLVQVPEDYRNAPPLAGIATGVLVTEVHDTLFVGFSGTDDLLVVDAQTQRVMDTVHVPAVRRRGVPDDIVNRLTQPGTTFPELFRAFSGLMGLHRLSDGHLALVHHDQEIDGRLITADVFLTVVAPSLDSACVDGLVTSSDVGQPVTTMVADTLVVLQQTVNSATDAYAVFSRYLIDRSDCRWLGTERSDGQ